MKVVTYMFLLTLSLSSFAQTSKIEGLPASNDIQPSELYLQRDALERYASTLRDVDQANAVSAIWFWPGADIKDEQCNKLITVEWFQSIKHKTDENLSYLRARFIPTWNGARCEYVISSAFNTFKQVSRYVMGGRGFSSEEMSTDLKIGVSDAQSRLLSRYPSLVVENFVLKSPLPPRNPSLYYWVIASVCTGTSKARTGEIFISAYDGTLLDDSWLSVNCQ